MATIVERGRTVFTNNYRQQPIAIVRGEGPYVWDEAGKRYLDLLGGAVVNGLGHCHGSVVAAIREQAGRLMHVSNFYYNGPSVELAERLVALGRPLALSRVFFCNSGTEANEAGLKLARRYQQVARGERGRTEVVAAVGSFHGRTVGSLSVTGQPKYHEGFAPLVDGVRFAPYGDLGEFARVVGEKTAAVIVEPIQGENGVVVPPSDFLPGLRALCSERGAVLMVDEVQTGCGRTGTFFACEQLGMKPDIVTLAKGLGGGLPIGAMLANDEVAAGFAPGAHAATFGGNPVTAAAAIAAVGEITRPGMLEAIRARGEEFRAGFARLVPKDGSEGLVREVRGRGLLIGVELSRDFADAVLAVARERGLLVNSIHNRVVRIAPPFILTAEQATTAILALTECIVDAAGGA